MIEEESEDHEAVDKLLQLSQIINADLEKYDMLRKGDFEGASNVIVKPLYILLCLNYWHAALVHLQSRIARQRALLILMAKLEEPRLHPRKIAMGP